MIPIQVITMMDSPTREVRDFVRQIATEDGTTFNMAMRGYEAMVGLIKRVANSEKEDKSFHEQGFAFRILEARKTFKYPLLRTVRSMEAEAVPGVHDKKPRKKGRKCLHPKCKYVTDESSYRFCKKHLPVNPPQDDGDLVYFCPPPKGVGKAITAGADRIKGRAMRTFGGNFVYVVPGVDEKAEPEIQEGCDGSEAAVQS